MLNGVYGGSVLILYEDQIGSSSDWGAWICINVGHLFFCGGVDRWAFSGF